MSPISSPKTVYRQAGSSFHVHDGSSLVIVHKLPAGTYLVQFHPMMGFYLDRVDNPQLPAKLYGDSEKYADRILNTFLDRPQTTGALLTGEKGCGKTIVAKLVAQRARIEHDIITLLVTNPYAGDAFSSFLQQIDQPAIVLIDEYEKVYAEGRSTSNSDDSGNSPARTAQEALLTVLDGVFVSKKLFILTCNEIDRVNKYMRNRPGRLYYQISFTGLTPEFVREVGADLLKQKDDLESLQQALFTYPFMSYDMLIALIEEMNRYGEKADEACKLLNIERTAKSERYLVSLVNEKGKPYQFDLTAGDTTLGTSPFCRAGYVLDFYPDNVTIPAGTETEYRRTGVIPAAKNSHNNDDDDGQYEEVVRNLNPAAALQTNFSTRIDLSAIVSMDPTTGTIIMATQDPKYFVRFKREPEYDYRTYTGNRVGTSFIGGDY